MSNHVQMSYYFLFVMLFMAVAFGVDAWQKKEMPQFLKATGVLLMAGILGVCINLSNLYHTYEYSKETMRGKSELVKPDSHNQTKVVWNEIISLSGATVSVRLSLCLSLM